MIYLGRLGLTKMKSLINSKCVANLITVGENCIKNQPQPLANQQQAVNAFFTTKSVESGQREIKGEKTEKRHKNVKDAEISSPKKAND